MSHPLPLPQGLSHDIAHLAARAEDYKSGRLTTAEFKKFHVPMGIYEQRTDGTYMVRLRATGGVMPPTQVLALLDVAQRHHAVFLHLTTRQEIQIHGVSLDSLAPILTELAAAGLATKGGGGDTVRNILVNEWSGIDADEVFDTTPYAEALTVRMVDEADSYGMPRKLKIAFSSTPHHIGHAGINDVGLVAKIVDGRRGFEVRVGGGAGGKATVSWPLFDFLPADDLYALVKAMKRLFHDHGNRESRAQARIRFIFYKNGVEETLQLIRQYFEEEKAKGVTLDIADTDDERPAYDYTPLTAPTDEAYALWQRRYVTAQPQEGYYSILLPILLGDFALEEERTEALRQLLLLVRRFGEHTFRFTTEQNIRLRNIPGAALPEVFRLLAPFHEETAVAPLANRIVSCTGAGICRMGICLSKGMATAIRRALIESPLDLDALSDIALHVTGCPNSCGMQVWADLGFAGRVVRGDRPYPAYQIFLAAGRHTAPRFAEPIGALNAHRIPAFVVGLLTAYQATADGRDFTTYLRQEGRDEALRLIEQLKDIPPFDEAPAYYTDFGAEKPFR